MSRLLIGKMETKILGGQKIEVFQDQKTGQYTLEEFVPNIELVSSEPGYTRIDAADKRNTYEIAIQDDGFVSVPGFTPNDSGFWDILQEVIDKSKGLTPHDVGTVEKKHPFEYQKPTDEQVAQITAMRDAMKAVYDNLMSLPESRERSIAITKLEEASMWMNKGIVFN